jgi:protein tyrosine phosphatase (PTP) superfamily phosphohydrolase (DUF442 family)
LRQECHGFVNGSPGSWYGLRNQTNAGKSDVEIAEQERELLSRLGSASAVKMHRIMHKTNGRIDKASTHEVSISRAETERELVERMGLRYAHFYITDHQHPNDKSVEQFVDFAQNLPEDAWLHFHCRSGSGRTSTFMILYDIIRNATAVSLDDIIHRQALLGSKDLYRLSELDAKRWKHDMAVARQEFITTFYDFVVDRDKYSHLPWIEWLAQRGLVKYRINRPLIP